MNEAFFSQLETWDGLGVVVRHDRPTGTWIFIALHSDRLGQPTGGSRMKVYPELSDALLDAQRLAEGMTYKWAGVGIARGGGKAVLAIPHPLGTDEKEGLLLRYGELIRSLSGAFATGADLGTGPQEIATIAKRTQYAHGVDPRDGSSTDPGPFTAGGVYEGLLAALEHVFSSRDLVGRSVLVEGIGGVGAPLTRRLAEHGTTLLVADLDEEKARRFAGELGAEVVALADVPDIECDVYAPCAVGATLNEETIPRLGCRIVAGSANNQLRTDGDAERLHERGIVYVPDYIINAGGAIAITYLLEASGHEELFERVATIGDTVASLLREASEKGESPLVSARRRVDRILAGTD